ncbi:hypothetical protein PRZ48_002513 [Zasmidium cellare]|uniref:Fungal N-terminal domain-containing protein n=1 Tax=Zasmidium cellare TaxID=395010 RepID=A0ABR0F487_ZASCE|nr:hypothetical protein PRZ48_002513 [Zasmidium cellare]
MPEPLSIVTGVATLLQSTWTVSRQLTKFYSGVAVVKQSIQYLQQDVDGLSDVLGSMRSTFESITAEQHSGTGHVAAHWDNISKAIVKGKDMLNQMVQLVEEIGQARKHLDGPRKQLRLDTAEDKLTAFRNHIRAFQDVLQLSVATLILANQEAFQKTNAQLLPNLEQLARDVRKIARDLNKIKASESNTPSSQDKSRAEVLSSTRDCVRSAASIISSASTAQGQRSDGTRSVVPDSNYADFFPAEHTPAIDRYMRSTTVDGYEDMSPRAAPQSVVDMSAWSDEGEGSSESGSDVEADLADNLLEEGKQEAKSGDLEAAEESFYHCLRRLPRLEAVRKSRTNKHMEVFGCLLDIYTAKKKWTEAQTILTRRIELRRRALSTEDAEYAHDVYLLACIMHERLNHVEAQLHARKSWARFKKLKHGDGVRRCLQLLIAISTAEKNESDLKAYTVTLKRLGGRVNESSEPLMHSPHRVGNPSSSSPSILSNESQSAHLFKTDSPGSRPSRHQETTPPLDTGNSEDETCTIDTAVTAQSVSRGSVKEITHSLNVKDGSDIEHLTFVSGSSIHGTPRASVSERENGKPSTRTLFNDQPSNGDSEGPTADLPELQIEEHADATPRSRSNSSAKEAHSDAEFYDVPCAETVSRLDDPSQWTPAWQEGSPLHGKGTANAVEAVPVSLLSQADPGELQKSGSDLSSLTSDDRLDTPLSDSGGISHTASVTTSALTVDEVVPQGPTGEVPVITKRQWPPMTLDVFEVVLIGTDFRVGLEYEPKKDQLWHLYRSYGDLESLQTQVRPHHRKRAHGGSITPSITRTLTSEQRKERLYVQVRRIGLLPRHILELPIVQEFFTLRPGDETDVSRTVAPFRYVFEEQFAHAPRIELNAASLAKASGEPVPSLQQSTNVENASSASVLGTDDGVLDKVKGKKPVPPSSKRQIWRKLFSTGESKDDEVMKELPKKVERRVVVVGDSVSGKTTLLHVPYLPEGDKKDLGQDPIPYFLVGNKKDLRHDKKTIETLKKMSQSPVTSEEVRQAACP